MLNELSRLSKISGKFGWCGVFWYH